MPVDPTTAVPAPASVPGGSSSGRHRVSPVPRPRRASRTRTRLFGIVGGLVSLAMVTGAGVAISAQATELTTIRMSTSDTPVLDAGGAVWSPRFGFADGRLITPPPAGTVIRKTRDQALYMTSMFGMTAWSAPVVDGTYSVMLRMVDTWYGNANQRVFRVNAEGRNAWPALRNIDIARNVGQFAAYSVTFTVTVNDGHLDLAFIKNLSQPTLSALMVTPARTAANRPPTSTPPTSTPPTSTPPTSTPPTSTSVRPDASNTGVPAGTTLTRVDGNNSVIRLTTAGATYQNLDIHGRVRIMAPNITIKNSIIRGDASYTLGSIVDVNYPGVDHSNFTLLNSEIVPEFPQWQQDGILGFGYSVIGSNIHGTTDAVKIVGDNVTVRDSYLHDTTYFVIPGVGYGDTHNDGIQAVKGNHVTITNNTITGNRNSAVMLGQDQGLITDWSFTGNYMDDGGCSVNTASKAYSSMGRLTFTDNDFGTHQANRGCAIVVNLAKTMVTASGNTWDSGAPFNLSRGM